MDTRIEETPADRLTLGIIEEHRRQRPYSYPDEHQTQPSTLHYAIIFNGNPSAAAVTGELVKLKRIPIPCSDDYQPEKASSMSYLCIYEELSTQIVCDGLKNAKQSYLNNYIDESGTILGSESNTSKHKIHCIDSIAFALSSWYANNYAKEKCDVPRTDVESICNILWPSIQLEPAIDQYCSCNDEECSADQFIASLRLDVHANDAARNDANRNSDFSARAPLPLRLIITGELTSNAYDIDSTQMGLSTLRRSIPTIPLISLVLRPVENASKCASILEDHLLRACVKRLLTGRVLLHSGNVTVGHASIRTSLSVKVPVKQSLSNGDELVTLQCFVVNIQSRIKTNDDDDDDDQRMYVVLPSTRIIFQATAASDVIEGTSQTKEVAPEEPTCESKLHQTITSPEQHLVESLRILVRSSGQQNRPLIPRVFLFSGPPGVGKTYAVKKAISVANSWADNSTNNSNAVHLVSIRGSELLAVSGGSNATTARELERNFEVAAKLCQSRHRK